MEICSFSPTINRVEEGKWPLATPNFEVTNSIFKITNDNNTFSISTPGHWFSRRRAGTINQLQKLLKLRSGNDNKLHVEEVRQMRNQIKIGENNYKLYDLDSFRNELFQEMKDVECNNREDMVFRMELTYDEVAEVLDTKHIATPSIG